MVSIKTADKYVAHVRRKIQGDPGRRSALRRSLGRPVEDVTTRKAHAVVAPWLPADRTPAVIESAYYSVAALIAAQPSKRGATSEDTPLIDEISPVEDPESSPAAQEKDRPSTTLGGTLGQAVQDRKLNPDTVESRLHLLCRQDVAGVHRMLPGLVRQLAAKDAEPDWGRLLCDLSRWQHQRGQVTKRWLQDYYRTINKSPKASPESEAQ
jgi:CRISPR type I-E-associated protein CasB/Cse2